MAKRKEGTIVNMGSVAGELYVCFDDVTMCNILIIGLSFSSPTPWTGHYDASKAAVRIMSEVLSLECKPFNIKVMYVSAAEIQSNIIGKHDDYQLPSDSLYGPFFHNIRARLDMARDKDAMETGLFAEEIISKADSANPPSYTLVGGKSAVYKFIAYLPRSWVLAIVWNIFSKPEDKPKGAQSRLL